MTKSHQFVVDISNVLLCYQSIQQKIFTFFFLIDLCLLVHKNKKTAITLSADKNVTETEIFRMITVGFFPYEPFPFTENNLQFC